MVLDDGDGIEQPPQHCHVVFLGDRLPLKGTGWTGYSRVVISNTVGIKDCPCNAGPFPVDEKGSARVWIVVTGYEDVGVADISMNVHLAVQAIHNLLGQRVDVRLGRLMVCKPLHRCSLFEIPEAFVRGPEVGHHDDHPVENVVHGDERRSNAQVGRKLMTFDSVAGSRTDFDD